MRDFACLVSLYLDDLLTCSLLTLRQFPTNIHNLQAFTGNFHTHLLKCKKAPADVVRALKVVKARHKTDVIAKPAGGQAKFFADMWDRIHGDFSPREDELPKTVATLNQIVEESTRKRGDVATPIPNVVSYEECASDVVVSDEDFEIALDLLRRPPTPDHADFDGEEAPPVDISPIPLQPTHTFANNGKEMEVQATPQKKPKKSKPKPKKEDDGKTRKFTR